MKITSLRACALVAAGAVAATLRAVVPSSETYVQVGLIAHWDGIDNAGRGVHDANATEWVNLATQGGNLPIAPLTAKSWAADHLVLTSGGANTSQKLISPSAINLGGAFTIEVTAFSNNGIIRRWESHPFTTNFESWTATGGSDNGYLERLQVGSNATRIKSSSDVISNEILAFTTTYDGTTHWQYVRRADGSQKSVSKALAGFTWNKQMAFLSGMESGGRGYSIRIYNRVLTEAERAYNSGIDQMRFQGRTSAQVVLPNSWKMSEALDLFDASDVMLVGCAVWSGNGNTTNWSDAGNWADRVGNPLAAAPAGGVVEIGAGATVTVSADVNVNDLRVSEGANITIAEGVALSAGKFTYDGANAGRGIFSGDAANGMQHSAVAGAGALRTAGDLAGIVPVKYRAPAADGFYEFGMLSEYMMGEGSRHGGASDTTTRHCVRAEAVMWKEWGLPPGAKVRLQGGVLLLDEIPSGWFSEVDTSKLKLVTPAARKVFEDGTPFVLPPNTQFRYTPGSWAFSTVSNCWYNTSVLSQSFLNDLVLNSASLKVFGNGTHYSNQAFDGKISGSGNIDFTNFGNHLNVNNDEFEFSGKITYGSDNGGSMRVFSPHVNANFTKIEMGNIPPGSWATNESFCSCLLLFGPKQGAQTTQGSFNIEQWVGYGGDRTDLKNKRFRCGGVLMVWGGNTVTINRMQHGIHLVAGAKDQDCNSGGMQSIATFGIGNVFVNDVESGNVYASTNVNVTIGKFSNGNAKIDYTYQKNSVNDMVLDITNSCPAGVQVLATDIAMLPARISGFAGTVNLTESANKTYPVTIDLAKGTSGVYNHGGCDGSGTLGNVPANGTLDVSFAGTDAPHEGEYAIARFTNAGNKLDGWNVLLNGSSDTTCVVGKGANARVVTLMRDPSGIWAKVKKGGLQIIIR